MNRAWFVAFLAAIPFFRIKATSASPVYEVVGGVGPAIPNPPSGRWAFKSRPHLAICFGQYDVLPIGTKPGTFDLTTLREHPYEPPSDERRLRAVHFQEVSSTWRA